MLREAIKKLHEWKLKKDRRPLIIRGARQVGKTWLVEEFGRSEFRNVVKLNFEKTPSLISIFDGDISPKRIIHMLEIASGENIIPEDTLLFFDEIQEAPRALTTLKYFAEEAPEYPIIAAGSLLGIAEHKGLSFPVGKISFMTLYPMTFKEFLLACGEKGLADLLSENTKMFSIFHDRYAEKLREYMLVGGMPSVVKEWVESHSTEKMRKVQEDLIEAYIADLSKHAPPEIAIRCRQIIMSLPSQFAKENSKFMYSIVKPGGKSKDFESSFAWLESCGIINIVHRITAPCVPLQAYEEQKVFKAYMHDTGLLSALSHIDPRIMIDGNSVFSMFRGALTEQYVLQELIAAGRKSIAYYSNERSTAEVDFILEEGQNIIPLEVKSGVNTKSKSLLAYKEKFSPCLSIRASLLPFIDQGWLINIPLYAVSKIGNILDSQEKV